LASSLSGKVPSVLAVTAVIVLLDLLLIVYVTSHGFQTANGGLVFGSVNFQLQWLPLIGVVVLSLAASSDAFNRIFPRWLGAGGDPTARLRYLRVFTVALLVFVCVLYIPYLVGSNWFWGNLSNASRSIGQLQGFGSWLERIEMPVLAIDPVLQYSITQIVACGSLVFVTLILARPQKRPRKLR
jgi:hypothetical protein